MSDTLEALKKVILWRGAQRILGKNSDIFRKDHRERTIIFSEYGNRDSSYGWEIGHIQSKRMGGSDNMNNLIAENWQTNLEKSQEEQQIISFANALGLRTPTTRL